MAGLMTRLGFDDAAPIESGMVTGAITQAQIKVETRNFDIRKRALEVDDVLKNQRQVIYGERRKILEKGDVRETVIGYLHDEAAALVDAEATSPDPEDRDLDKRPLTTRSTGPSTARPRRGAASSVVPTSASRRSASSTIRTRWATASPSSS